MTTRDAELLARLLDGDAPAGDEVGRDVAALAALAERMEARAVAPRPAFRAALRRRLLLAAAAPPPPTWRARLRAAFEDGFAQVRSSTRVATATGLAAAALVVGGVGLAAQSALPGDAFYAVKTAMEEVRLDRAASAAERGLLLLEITEVRIGEAERAVDAGRHASAGAALASADESVRGAAELLLGEFLATGETASYRPLLDFVQEHRPRLDDLAPHLVGEPRTALDALRTSLGRIEARIGGLVGGCCPELTAAPGLPQAGIGFDFTRVPPAHEPFNPCPCQWPIEAGATASDGTSAEEPAQSAPGIDTAPVPAPGDGSAGDGGGTLPGGTTERAQDSIDDTTGRVGDTTDGTRSVLDDVVDDVQDGADRLLPGEEPVSETLDPIRDRLDRAKKELTDTVDDTVEELGDTAEDVLDLP